MSLPEKNPARVSFTTRFDAHEGMYMSAVLNKLEPFLGSLAVQRFLDQPTTTFDLFGAIDRGDTVLINLADPYCFSSMSAIVTILRVSETLGGGASRRSGMDGSSNEG
jgi:hypothetical protein